MYRRSEFPWIKLAKRLAIAQFYGLSGSERRRSIGQSPKNVKTSCDSQLHSLFFKQRGYLHDLNVVVLQFFLIDEFCAEFFKDFLWHTRFAFSSYIMVWGMQLFQNDVKGPSQFAKLTSQSALQSPLQYFPFENGKTCMSLRMRLNFSVKLVY